MHVWAFLTGLASSFVYIPALTTVQWWYPEKTGVVSGIVSMVFGLSAAVMSPLFGKTLISLGYVSMNLSIAILALLIGLAGAYFARAPKAAMAVFLSSPSSGRRPQRSCRRDCVSEEIPCGRGGRRHEPPVHSIRGIHAQNLTSTSTSFAP